MADYPTWICADCGERWGRRPEGNPHGATWHMGTCDRDRAAVERPEPEEPGGHWATRENEPDSRTDPEGHRDWQRDRDAQRREGTW